MEVKENSPDRYVMERHFPPGTGKTPPHIHQDGIERFELIEGQAAGSVGGRTADASAPAT